MYFALRILCYGGDHSPLLILELVCFTILTTKSNPISMHHQLKGDLDISCPNSATPRYNPGTLPIPTPSFLNSYRVQ
jgi:hypothetical protein